MPRFLALHEPARPQHGMFPRGLSELGSQDVKTTLAGLPQGKCYLTSTGTSRSWNGVTEISIPANGHSNKTCPASSMLRISVLLWAKNVSAFSWFPNMSDGLQRGHPFWRMCSKRSCSRTNIQTSSQSILNYPSQWQINILGCSGGKPYHWPDPQPCKNMFFCFDLGELKSFSQGAKFPAVEDSSLNQWTHSWELSLMWLFLKCPVSADILFRKCQTSARTGSWGISVGTNLYIHTGMHGCSLPLKIGFVLHPLTPGNIQIALQSEGWDVIKSWQQIFWCIWCALAPGIRITQHRLQEWEEACTGEVSGCKVTWREKETQNAIMMMRTCTFWPYVSVRMCCSPFLNNRTEAQFHWSSFHWLHPGSIICQIPLQAPPQHWHSHHRLFNHRMVWPGRNLEGCPVPTCLPWAGTCPSRPSCSGSQLIGRRAKLFVHRIPVDPMWIRNNCIFPPFTPKSNNRQEITKSPLD